MAAVSRFVPSPLAPKSRTLKAPAARPVPGNPTARMSSPTGVQRSRVRFGDKDFIVVFQRDVSASTNQLQHLIVTRQAAVSKAFPLWRAAFLLEKSALCVPSK